MNRYIFGLGLKDSSGCLHYDSPLDIIAIQFKCCQRYYACFECHLALETHAPLRWRPEEFHRPAILCRKCGYKLSIAVYFRTQECPSCRAFFNPRCQLHWDLYFEKNS